MIVAERAASDRPRFADVAGAVAKALDALAAADCAHPRAFASTHEGWAVLREELQELTEAVDGAMWRGVRMNDLAAVRAEAAQVAAMALRILRDLED